MPLNLSGLHIEAPMPYGSHALVTRSGKVFYVELSGATNYLIGEPMSEMGALGDYIIPTTIRGRRPEAKRYSLHLDPFPALSIKHRREALEDALVEPMTLWLPDGRTMPLHYGQTVDKPEAEYSRLEVDLLPKTFGLKVPVLDDASLGGLVRVTDQSSRGVPILSFEASGTLSYAVDIATITRFTTEFGTRVGTRDTHTFIEYGGEDGLSIRFDGANWVFDLFGTTVTIPELDAGLFDTPHVWAVTGTLPGSASIHLVSALTGYKSFGSYALGAPVAVTDKQVSASLTGLLMPGASNYDLPYFGLVRTPITELKARMVSHYDSITSHDAITIPPAPYELQLLIDPAETTIVAGQSKTITATLILSGGIPSGTQYVLEVDNDEPGIEVTKGELTDVTDDEVAAKSATITIAVKDNVSEGEHALTVRARAVDWVDDPTHPFYKVTDEEVLTVNASLYGPEIAPGAIMVLPMTAQSEAGVKAYTAANFRREHQTDLLLETSAAGVWPTSRMDGWRSNGSAGSYIRTAAITGRTLAKGVEIASPIADFASMADGAVIVALLSTTRKGDYCYAYKTSTGARVRTSKQNTDTFTDGVTNADSNLLTVSDLSQCVLMTTPTEVILWDMATNGAAKAANPGWVDSGSVRASWFCLSLSDGTISSPTRGIVLAATAHASELTPVRRDRNIRFIANQYARRDSIFARPEYPLNTGAIWEMNPGEATLDRTLWGQTIQKVGTGITEETDGGITSAGNTSSGIWSGWLPITWANDFTVVVVVKEITTTLGSGRQIGISDEDSWNRYIMLRILSAGGGKFDAVLNVGTVQTPFTGVPVQPLYAFTFTFVKGTGTANGTMTIRERYSNKTWATLSIPNTYSGRVSAMGGGNYRGKNDSNVIHGIAQQNPVRLKSMWYGRGTFTDLELQTVTDNLSGLYPAVLPPPLEEDTTAPLPVDPASAAIYDRTTLYNQLALLSVSNPDLNTVYTDTNTRFWADAYNTAKPNNKYRYPAGTEGNIAKTIKRVPLDWDGDPAKVVNARSAGQKYYESGIYHMARIEMGQQIGVYARAIATAQDSGMLVNIANMVDFITDSLDYRASPESTKKASEINSTLTNYLNIIYGTGGETQSADNLTANVGKIIALEQGILAGFLMEGAHALWTFRAQSPALTPNLYIDLVYKAMAFVKMHMFPAWEQYHKRTGNWYASGTSGPKATPGWIKKAFTHSDLGEAKAAMFIGIIESEMFAAGMTAPRSVTLKGWDYTTTYGVMTASNWTGNYVLEPGTSDNKATHPYYQDAVWMFEGWYATAVWIIPATQIIDNTNRGRYAVGTAHWRQGVPSTKPSVQSLFPQPTTYLSDTIPSLRSLHFYGVMDEALGSAGSADTFMKRVAAGMAVATYRNYAATTIGQRVPYNSVGVIEKTVNGVTVKESPYADPPFNPGQGGWAATSQAVEGVQLEMAGFDSTGHLSTIMRTLWDGDSNKTKRLGAPVAGMVTDKIKRTVLANTG